MTALLTGVVVVLVLSHTPKAVMNIYESYQVTFTSFLHLKSQRLVYGSLNPEPLWGRLVIKLSHFLLGLGSAMNLLIYSYKVNNQNCLTL